MGPRNHRIDPGSRTGEPVSNPLKQVEDVAVAVFRTPEDLDLPDGLHREIPHRWIVMIRKVLRARLEDVIEALDPRLPGKGVGGQGSVARTLGSREVLFHRLHGRIAGPEELPRLLGS